MIFLASLAVLILVVLLILLFMPIVLRIDTGRDLYQIQWGRVNVWLVIHEEYLSYRFQAPFISREGPLFPAAKRSLKRPVVRTSTDRRGLGGRRSGRSFVRTGLRMLRSFRVRRFHLSVDTDDVIWNARFFPFFHLWRQRGHDVRIVFTGRNELQLMLDNTLLRLLVAWIRS